MFKNWIKNITGDKPKATTEQPQDVRSFYNEHNDSFLKVYGDVIQAFRTTDVTKYLDHTINSAGITDGTRLLDAGCGVAGPATYFAQKLPGLKVECVTVSDVQAKAAAEKVQEKGLTDRVNITHADYHTLHEVFEKESFDQVVFLESFGHSTQKERLLRSAWDVLKPGGSLYIKDLFLRIGHSDELQEKINMEAEKINKAYHYQINDLGEMVDMVRKIGYAIEFVKTIDIDLNEFENLTISNDFQELTGIARIEDWGKYTFPVDFFELKLYKPPYNMMEYEGKYFLQVIYKQLQNKQ